MWCPFVSERVKVKRYLKANLHLCRGFCCMDIWKIHLFRFLHSYPIRQCRHLVVAQKTPNGKQNTLRNIGDSDRVGSVTLKVRMSLRIFHPIPFSKMRAKTLLLLHWIIVPQTLVWTKVSRSQPAILKSPLEILTFPSDLPKSTLSRPP